MKDLYLWDAGIHSLAQYIYQKECIFNYFLNWFIPEEIQVMTAGMWSWLWEWLNSKDEEMDWSTIMCVCCIWNEMGVMQLVNCLHTYSIGRVSHIMHNAMVNSHYVLFSVLNMGNNDC